MTKYHETEYVQLLYWHNGFNDLLSNDLNDKMFKTLVTMLNC